MTNPGFANGGDWWFHAKNMAGSHVIVRKEQAETLPDATFEEAGRLAAYYSKGRQAPKVEIDESIADEEIFSSVIPDTSFNAAFTPFALILSFNSTLCGSSALSYFYAAAIPANNASTGRPYSNAVFVGFVKRSVALNFLNGSLPTRAVSSTKDSKRLMKVSLMKKSLKLLKKQCSRVVWH